MYWTGKKGRQARTSAMEMYSMNYAQALYWAPSSEPNIEASICNCSFLEFPVRRLYTMLRIEQSATQVVQLQDEWNFYR